MNRTFTLSKLRNGKDRSCPSDREKMLSARAAQTARQTLGETLAAVGGSLDGLAERDAVERLVKWFVESLLSQTLVVHMIRTRKIPLVQSAAAPPVLLLTAAVIVIGILIPFSPLGASVGLQPLPASYFSWLVVTLIAHCALTQLIKSIYVRRFAKWL
jgi:magnesium-transporting ATPase (P-type)